MESLGIGEEEEPKVRIRPADLTRPAGIDNKCCRSIDNKIGRLN